jgi:hypothetical protein
VTASHRGIIFSSVIIVTGWQLREQYGAYGFHIKEKTTKPKQLSGICSIYSFFFM